MVKISLEPRAGGRWYGFNSDGCECELGKVLVYEPYALFALDWQTDANLQYQPELHTEVRVEFIPEGDRQTRVKLTHYDVQRLGEAAGSINEGWCGIMDVYQNFVNNSSVPKLISPSAPKKR